MLGRATGRCQQADKGAQRVEDAQIIYESHQKTAGSAGHKAEHQHPFTTQFVSQRAANCPANQVGHREYGKEYAYLRHADAKVIVVSGYSRDSKLKASLGAGAAGYIVKPFKKIELLPVIRQILS